LELSLVEFDLLHYLARHPGRLVSRPQLDQEIFNRDPQLQTKSNMLDVYILRLRRKLGSDRIVTHRGLGFSLHG
jgi:two-component system OmpR family response regulator